MGVFSSSHAVAPDLPVPLVQSIYFDHYDPGTNTVYYVTYGKSPKIVESIILGHIPSSMRDKVALDMMGLGSRKLCSLIMSKKLWNVRLAYLKTCTVSSDDHLIIHAWIPTTSSPGKLLDFILGQIGQEASCMIRINALTSDYDELIMQYFVQGIKKLNVSPVPTGKGVVEALTYLDTNSDLLARVMRTIPPEYLPFIRVLPRLEFSQEAQNRIRSCVAEMCDNSSCDIFQDTITIYVPDRDSIDQEILAERIGHDVVKRATLSIRIGGNRPREHFAETRRDAAPALLGAHPDTRTDSRAGFGQRHIAWSVRDDAQDVCGPLSQDALENDGIVYHVVAKHLPADGQGAKNRDRSHEGPSHRVSRVHPRVSAPVRHEEGADVGQEATRVGVTLESGHDRGGENGGQRGEFGRDEFEEREQREQLEQLEQRGRGGGERDEWAISGQGNAMGRESPDKLGADGRGQLIGGGGIGGGGGSERDERRGGGSPGAIHGGAGNIVEHTANRGDETAKEESRHN